MQPGVININTVVGVIGIKYNFTAVKKELDVFSHFLSAKHSLSLPKRWNWSPRYLSTFSTVASQLAPGNGDFSGV